MATRPLRLVVGDVGTRMTVIRLRDGSLLLHSPVPLDAATRAALDAIGPVRAVVAPSLVHHFYVGEYGAAYPEARLYAAPGLERKRADVRFAAVLDDEPPAPWAGQLEQCVFRGAPIINEVVFFHPPTRTLLLTDLCFNVVRPMRGRARLFLRLVGARGFGPHRIVRFGIRDRAAARASLERILRWDFDRVIVTHGDVLEAGGHAAMRTAFAWL
ncbi:MAG: DUF4336 domain-containing protein [Candidatus Binatia bacterium]